MNRFTGTLPLVRLILRRDRIRLPIWLVSLIGLVGASAAGVQGLYDTPAAQATYERTVGNSGASIAMSGPPTALGTAGGITIFEVAFTTVIGIALMAIFLTLRHTRTDEEAGRTELLRAGVMGRQADLAATGIVVSGASLVVGAGVTATFLASGLPPGGSLLYGAAMGSLGLAFTGIALVAAQVAEHARGAVGLSLAALGVLYLVRAAGDIAGNGLSWVSPIGWAQAVGAFGTDERWWPVVLPVLFGAALAVLAGWLTTRRDLGGGLVPARPGPPTASRWLSGPVGLAARLQRTALLGWAAGMAALGVAFGSLGTDIEEMIEGNPELEEVFAQGTGGATVIESYFASVLMISALAATGFTIGSVLRLRSEETALRAEPLLATPVSRVRWVAGSLLVTLAGTTVVMMALGIGAGVSYAAVSGDAGQFGDLLGATLTYLPATLALGGLAMLLFGWLPGLAAGAAWGALAACFVVGWLGQVLSLPDWLIRLSPFGRTPQVPMADLSWGPLLAITAVTALLVVAGFAGFRRRDLATG